MTNLTAAQKKALATFVVDHGAGPRIYRGAKPLDARSATALVKRGLLEVVSREQDVYGRFGGSSFGADRFTKRVRFVEYRITEAGVELLDK